MLPFCKREGPARLFPFSRFSYFKIANLIIRRAISRRTTTCVYTCHTFLMLCIPIFLRSREIKIQILQRAARLSHRPPDAPPEHIGLLVLRSGGKDFSDSPSLSACIGRFPQSSHLPTRNAHSHSLRPRRRRLISTLLPRVNHHALSC